MQKKPQADQEKKEGRKGGRERLAERPKQSFSGFNEKCASQARVLNTPPSGADGTVWGGYSSLRRQEEILPRGLEEFTALTYFSLFPLLPECG